jgi:hypothetical protein
MEANGDDYRLGLSSFTSCCERLAKKEAHPYTDTMIPEAAIWMMLARDSFF